MTRKYFGTDGIRGRVGKDPITPEFLMKLGYCAGKVLSRADVAPPHRERPAVLIGKDTRWSLRSSRAFPPPASTRCWWARCPRPASRSSRGHCAFRRES